MALECLGSSWARLGEPCGLVWNSGGGESQKCIVPSACDMGHKGWFPGVPRDSDLELSGSGDVLIPLICSPVVSHQRASRVVRG